MNYEEISWEEQSALALRAGIPFARKVFFWKYIRVY